MEKAFYPCQQKRIIKSAALESQPFADFHDDQIKLVRHPELFDLSLLDGIRKKITALISAPKSRAYIDEERMNKIIDVILTRIEMLKEQFRLMSAGC